jgi:ubiquinone biosynthesis protein COQ4
VIAIVSSHRIARACPGQPARRMVLEGYRNGRRADWLVGADWEALLAEPVAAIRARYRVRTPTYYPRVLAAVRASRMIDETSPAMG